MNVNKNPKRKQVTGLSFEGPYTIPVTSSNGMSFSCRANSTIKLNESEIAPQEKVKFYPNNLNNRSQK